MQDNDNQTKITFSKQGAILGLISYIVLASILATVFIYG